MEAQDGALRHGARQGMTPESINHDAAPFPVAAFVADFKSAFETAKVAYLARDGVVLKGVKGDEGVVPVMGYDKSK